MSDCIFCKIIEGKIPSTKIYEDEFFVVIKDINPLYKIHHLIITKKHIPSVNDVEIKDESIFSSIFSVAKKIAILEKVTESGYRLVVNSGEDAGQVVPHFHMHFLAGEKLNVL
ncbi:MAG: histidine triad nucleotide-binding protein [bacterium]